MVVEGHRFDIFEEVGCLPAIYNVTLAFPLVYVWPLIIGLITVFYGCTLGSYRLSPSFAAYHT